MTEIAYDVYMIIDGNASNLSRKNLAPLGIMKFENQLVKDQQVTIKYWHQDKLSAEVFCKVIDITKTSGPDNLIMIETGREDY